MKVARPHLIAAALAAGLATAPAVAQEVYRCGNSYGTTPCHGGVLVDTQNSATAEQAAGSRAAARRDAQMADRMERDRLERDALAPKAIILPERQAAAPEPASGASKPRRDGGKKTKKKQPEHFTAIAPKTAR